jgi:hypothetical protein
MTYRVEINDCLDQFHRAHRSLMDSLGGAAHLARTSGPGNSHWQLMEHNWKTKYNITPRNGSGSTAWKYLDFDSEKHYTAFILKWS